MNWIGIELKYSESNLNLNWIENAELLELNWIELNWIERNELIRALDITQNLRPVAG